MKKHNVQGFKQSKKTPVIVMDKFFQGKIAPKNTEFLTGWASLYFKIHVIGSPKKTEMAKKKDLSKFLDFYSREVGHDRVDSWTPAVTKQFQHELKNKISAFTNKPYKATTINRVMATVRHFGNWLHKQRPLLAGSPFHAVKDIQTDLPDWNGLTNRQIMRLKAACEQRLKSCQRADQNPVLEAAVFYILLHTGLRESELTSLNVSQYHHRGFHDVKRKGNRITKKVSVPSEAKEILDRYLEGRKLKNNDPLFISRYKKRIAAQDVARICLRLSNQASAHLNKSEAFRLTPHMLRHNFLKRVADKHGVHVAQQMSGNVSIQEIFRYTKPSQKEIDETAEELFL
ncbi:MAG: tyrosine-type recombinase/integrase [bacterium]